MCIKSSTFLTHVCDDYLFADIEIMEPGKKQLFLLVRSHFSLHPSKGLKFCNFLGS